MNIIPISSNPAITPLQTLFPAEKTAASGESFSSIFNDAVSNLEELNSIKGADAIDLSLSNLDDLVTMQANSQKAEIALQLLVQMRNKVLESYQEVMRMNL